MTNVLDLKDETKASMDLCDEYWKSCKTKAYNIGDPLSVLECLNALAEVGANDQTMITQYTDFYNSLLSQVSSIDSKINTLIANELYCVSVTLYPFLLDGLSKLGGESKAPQHLASFCGSFINLVFAISAQFAGAVATVEFLTYFDYFARKDYGDDYLDYEIGRASCRERV